MLLQRHIKAMDSVFLSSLFFFLLRSLSEYVNIYLFYPRYEVILKIVPSFDDFHSG